MEVYILDSLNRFTQVVDRFVSFIWAERSKAFGDFELTLPSIPSNRRIFQPGVKLSFNETLRVAVVETVEDSTDSEGRDLLSVKGRTLEYILNNRVARGSNNDLTTEPKWILTGTPTEIVRQMFHDICVLGILDEGDIIPGIVESSLFPEDTLPEPEDEITYAVSPMTLYSAMTQLCDAYDIGFRITRDLVTSQLHFDVYMGSDRTGSQTDLDAIIFSPDLGNLQNTSQLTTSALYKNVAYVYSPVGFEMVYPLDVDPEVEGFERHVLLVEATDIDDPDGPTASALMIQRGLEELAKNRKYAAFDGELSQNSGYKYGTHYHLNDLVEIRSDTGATSKMQVTEQIFVSDKEGERKYPTLSLNQFVTPGAWIDPMFLKEWDDMDDEEWEDMP